MTKLDQEARMTIKKLHARGVQKAEIARMLGVREGTVRYHLLRQAQQKADGRSVVKSGVARHHRAIESWKEAQEDEGINLTLLHEHLIAEHGFTGSLRAVQRYWGQAFPAPKRRARRRVETPAGAQAQVDWGEYRDVWIGGAKTTLYALHIQLSYSRFGAVVWSRRKNQIAWQGAHNEALRRLGGVPATLRVDNEKTAMARGAGAHGTINMQYRRYAQVVRFHIDACAPRAPEHKGKVERRICDQRFRDDPRKRHWNDLRELQAWTDHRVELSAKRRRCPATGTPVIEAWEQERPLLQPLPILPEPFDVAVRRPVGIDCMVNFEGRQYSVPFALCGRSVEVRGCVDEVQVLTPSAVVARHPRGTKERIVIDPAHFEGEATQDMLPPLPLGRMGRKLAEIAALEPERRPIDLYAALAEVAR